MESGSSTSGHDHQLHDVLDLEAASVPLLMDRRAKQNQDAYSSARRKEAFAWMSGPVRVQLDDSIDRSGTPSGWSRL